MHSELRLNSIAFNGFTAHRTRIFHFLHLSLLVSDSVKSGDVLNTKQERKDRKLWLLWKLDTLDMDFIYTAVITKSPNLGAKSIKRTSFISSLLFFYFVFLLLLFFLFSLSLISPLILIKLSLGSNLPRLVFFLRGYLTILTLICFLKSQSVQWG